MKKPEIGFTGYAPVVRVTNNRPSERELYRQMWEKEEYRRVAPGEACIMEFLSQAKPKPGSTVIDLGCGTGRAGLALSLVGGMKVVLLDFAENCLDDDMKEMVAAQPQALSFIEADLTKKLPVVAEYGFSTDVLEHIPPDDVDAVLNNCLMACKHVFFQIATTEDVSGKLVGHQLHLSVHPYEWWLEKFRERGCVIHWAQKSQWRCQFYVSAWTDGPSIVEVGKLNATQEAIRENVKFNIAQGWQQVVPHPTNETEVMIVGGGWSLPEFQDDIHHKRAADVKLITLNGAYGWCLERGLIPSALIMVDSRPHNFRFSKPVIDNCKYFIASQCHPSVFEGLPKDRTYIWHTSADLIGDLLKAEYGEDAWYPVPGGSTALLRSIPLLRMLGFKSFHLYGCDSCISDKQHHAYPQPENDSEQIFPVVANPSGRIFHGHTWMISQAQEFMDLIKFLGEEINLEVHGDGLLAHILNTGAELSDIGDKHDSIKTST